MSNKLLQKIKLFNKSYTQFSKALKTIELNINKTPDIETHLWRIKKSFDVLQLEIMKQLDKESINNEFKNITKKLKRNK